MLAKIFEPTLDVFRRLSRTALNSAEVIWKRLRTFDSSVAENSNAADFEEEKLLFLFLNWKKVITGTSSLREFIDYRPEIKPIFQGIYMMISAGVGLFLLGFIGCAAAVRQNRTAFFHLNFKHLQITLQ
jgi:hypothetical protein